MNRQEVLRIDKEYLRISYEVRYGKIRICNEIVMLRRQFSRSLYLRSLCVFPRVFFAVGMNSFKIEKSLKWPDFGLRDHLSRTSGRLAGHWCF
jgi:hypothetical protein